MRNNIDGDSFAIDKEGLMSGIGFGKFRTTYVSWENVEEIQIGKQKLFSPTAGNLAMKLELSPIQLDEPTIKWQVDISNITNTFQKICSGNGITVDQFISDVAERHSSESWEIVLLLSMLVIIVWNMTLTWFVYFHNSETKAMNIDDESIPEVENNSDEEFRAGVITEGVYPNSPRLVCIDRKQNNFHKDLGRCSLGEFPWESATDDVAYRLNIG